MGSRLVDEPTATAAAFPIVGVIGSVSLEGSGTLWKGAAGAFAWLRCPYSGRYYSSPGQM